MLTFREYGPRFGRPEVVVLHGGPGAPGSAGALAHLIADPGRVLEPWQKATSVADHVDDIGAFVDAKCDGPPVLVGHSWGAMLALVFAAAHPSKVRGVCLVGSGTFDRASRAVFKQTLSAMRDGVYEVDPLPEDELDATVFDRPANEQSWNDMLRLQADGTYPAAFSKIEVPVLMLHGTADPHPGRMICESLQMFLPQLEYREFDRCGHYPWRERGARAAFLSQIREWLASFVRA